MERRLCIILQKQNNGIIGERIDILQINNVSARAPKSIKQFECELILFVFFLLRFVFKNIHELPAFFTSMPILNIPPAGASIATGVVVLLSVIILLSFGLGKLIKSYPLDSENPLIYLVAIFLACPASLPFLFSTDSAAGTQLLYPFALFIFSLSIVRVPIIQWLLPLLCAAYLIPSVHSSENLFLILRNGAILYLPLTLLYLYLNMMTPHLLANNKTMPIEAKSPPALLFIISGLVSIGSYIYILISDKPFYENAFSFGQPLNVSFLVSLFLAAPAAVTAVAVMRIASKSKFPSYILTPFIYAPIVLFLFFRGNYTGLWIPFVLLSLFMLIFYGVRHNNPAVLSGVRSTGIFFEKHRILFFLLLLTTASLLDTSTPYMSSVFKTILQAVPY